jgi:hypothetical protein
LNYNRCGTGAGLSAGLYAGYYGLRSIIFEENIPGGLASEIPLLENYPGFYEGIRTIGEEWAQNILIGKKSGVHMVSMGGRNWHKEAGQKQWGEIEMAGDWDRLTSGSAGRWKWVETD